MAKKKDLKVIQGGKTGKIVTADFGGKLSEIEKLKGKIFAIQAINNNLDKQWAEVNEWRAKTTDIYKFNVGRIAALNEMIKEIEDESQHIIEENLTKEPVEENKPEV